MFPSRLYPYPSKEKTLNDKHYPTFPCPRSPSACTPHLRERQSTTSVPASAPSQSGIFSSMNFHINLSCSFCFHSWSTKVVRTQYVNWVIHFCFSLLLHTGPAPGLSIFPPHSTENSFPVSASVGASTLLCLTHLDYLNSVSHDSKLVTFFTSCMSSSSAAMNPATNLRLLHYVPQTPWSAKSKAL